VIKVYVQAEEAIMACNSLQAPWWHNYLSAWSKNLGMLKMGTSNDAKQLCPTDFVWFPLKSGLVPIKTV